MIPRGYVLVVDADGCRHRRYFRWHEIPAALRLPEQLWPMCWGTEGLCAATVPNRRSGQDVRFHPCGMKRRVGSDIYALHAMKERYPGYQHVAEGTT